MTFKEEQTYNAINNKTILLKKGGNDMAEIIKCSNPDCQEYINLEVEILRDGNGNIYCAKCGELIKEVE